LVSNSLATRARSRVLGHNERRGRPTHPEPERARRV